MHGKKTVSILSKIRQLNKKQIVFFLLLTVFIFLRFYELPQRSLIGWDQADSAWAAKSILYDNPVKLDGVPIKGNAGLTMGPFYYYLITPFYFFTGLDLIASSIFAGVISVISFLIFYYITKKIFNTNIALLASFFYTFSYTVIMFDRIQAAFVLIPILSYSVFYCLYKSVTGDTKYLLYLAAVIGFGFHIHFTTIFYLLMVILMLPFFPRNKRTIQHVLFATGIFLIFISPLLFSVVTRGGSGGFINYFNTSFHGFHLRRLLQLSHDAFITFEGILQFKFLRPTVFIVVPLFIAVYYFVNKNKGVKERFIMPYMITIWILVPWIILSTYSGELTDYYFSIPRNIGFAIVAFLLMQLYIQKQLIAKLFVIGVSAVYAIYSLNLFFNASYGNYLKIKSEVEVGIKAKRVFQYQDHDPVYYTYYIYKKHKKL